ncbi:alpha-ketoacid dehydrogenase subunit beta [Pseudonocardia spinosispora]|uniref:alpha-ketoacid dehydrogenase subunit beta n=1 Tax=Pseudonocardia spinosispora TaxID=103441 RepID=UPI00040719AD|nr:alpha-ketoacid dehydrogenase subunit beta [Pseudonocardia spinosispora]
MTVDVETARITMAQALNQAMDNELARDESVFLLGEDIIDPAGGVMKVTAGLSTKYGTERVRETPISEQAIIGAATGAALLGMRPVAEIMIADFYAVCLDQLVNHAAKLRYMSGGRTHVPITVRGMSTGGLMFGAQHSQMVEAWMAHVPGLKIAIPSTPADAKGLLTAAIRDDDPTIVIESAALYAQKGHVPVGEHVVPLGSADVKRPGSDVTLITYGKPVHDCLAVATQLEGEFDVEVLDLRSIVPWDSAAMLESVGRTRRAVVVHQAVQRFGVGAEIAAFLNQELWGTLAAPVLRVGAEYTPVPYSPELEASHLPSPAKIADAVRAACKS